AQRGWQNADPVGQFISLPDVSAATSWTVAAPDAGAWLQIIGVAADVPNNGLNDAVVPAIYVPYSLVIGDSFRLITRTLSDPLNILGPVAERIQAIDPNQPINQVRTAAQALDAEGW